MRIGRVTIYNKLSIVPKKLNVASDRDSVRDHAVANDCAKALLLHNKLTIIRVRVIREKVLSCR